MRAAPTPTPTDALLSGADRPVRVLVVEDDLDLRTAVCDLLRFEGIEAAEAENGLEALLHLRAATPPPDVILLDLAMPVMTGWEFREAQLRDAVLARVPVIVLSSRSPEGLPVDAVLVKPCRPEALVEAIERVVQPRGGASA